MATGLGIIGGNKSIDCKVHPLQGIKRPIGKVGTLITNNRLRHAKSGKNVLLMEFHNHIVLVGMTSTVLET